MISTHALREEGDLRDRGKVRQICISTHALREEGDLQNIKNLLQSIIFLPTPSARRATNGFFGVAHVHCISTHALREEGDLLAALW